MTSVPVKAPQDLTPREPDFVPTTMLTTKVTLQNISVSNGQKSWISMGLPLNVASEIERVESDSEAAAYTPQATSNYSMSSL